MSEPSRASPLPRLGTGSRELDAILGGGFPANSINILMGHPGTGKTILAEQILFHNASADGPALYLTTLSEPLPKILTYVQRLEFFNEQQLLEAIRYEDVGMALMEWGIGALLETLTARIKEVAPKIIVIDSFKAVHDLVRDPSEMRRLISELAGRLGAFEATTFLVGEYSEEQIPRHPEFSVADGIVQLSRLAESNRDERLLRVMKLRGSGYQEGLHAFSITGAGLEVFPRLVSPRAPARTDLGHGRVKFGIDGLDAILDGGVWQSSNTLVSGPAGSGKTTMALEFVVHGAALGQPTLFVNFQENPSMLAHTVDALTEGREDTQGRLSLIYRSPVELGIDSLVGEILDLVGEKGVTRVAIDSLDDIALAAHTHERFHDYLYALTQSLMAAGVTTVTTIESPAPAAPPVHDHRFSAMSDALVELWVEPGWNPRRLLRVVKARGTAHDLRPHEFVIEDGGIRILEPAEAR